MKPQTKEFLYFLLWSLDHLERPTFRNLTDSYEEWAYRTGFFRQVGRLETNQLIERDQAKPDDRVYRLTEQGRIQALGGRDPEAQWSRAWDGRWRLVIFDVPTAQNARRERLRRYLRDRAFGCLQKSVWITPDPLQEERDILAGGKVDAGSLILLEARPCADESDADIVADAWDFEHINHSYARHLEVLEKCPDDLLRNATAAKALRQWAAAERQAWLDAISADPLLPEGLLPPDYLGRQAWRRRLEMFSRAGQQLRTFAS